MFGDDFSKYVEDHMNMRGAMIEALEKRRKEFENDFERACPGAGTEAQLGVIFRQNQEIMRILDVLILKT